MKYPIPAFAITLILGGCAAPQYSDMAPDLQKAELYVNVACTAQGGESDTSLFAGLDPATEQTTFNTGNLSHAELRESDIPQGIHKGSLAGMAPFAHSAHASTPCPAAIVDTMLRIPSGDKRIFLMPGKGGLSKAGAIESARAELKAAGGNIYSLAGNNDGLIQATGVTIKNGQIWLTADSDLQENSEVSRQNRVPPKAATDL
jgi:hypothetical protein